MLVPLTALIGSGIDLGRIYVAQQRLQVACDAASLAGRRAVSAGQASSAVQAEALKFFNYNFPAQSYGTAAFTPAVTVGSSTPIVVTVVANTTLPMSVMTIFGFTQQPISVTCNAQQDFTNTDVVLVLDTTGSMACDVNGNNCNSGSSSKIAGLRNAVMALYDQLAPIQTQLAAAGLRMRIGIVPYASSVNVGKLIYDASPSYLSTIGWSYASRAITTSATTSSACTNLPTASRNPGLGGTYNSALGLCTYFKYSSVRVTPTLSQTSNYLAGNNVDVTPLIGNTTSGTNDGLTPSTSTSAQNTTWAGCIEENPTTTMSSTATSIDTLAYDLNANTTPAPLLNQWHAYWPELEYIPNLYNSSYKPQMACPTPAKAMQWWTRSDLLTYVNSLNPDGGTYHDNGMRWGMRLDSASGIFGAGNPNTYGNMPVKKYIIFMTDGLMDTGYSTLYTTYGVESIDKRVTGGTNETDQTARHLNRFDLLCAAAKSDPYNYNIWVVGFAQTLDSHLTNCASNAGQASTASDSNALIQQFVTIGKNIGALRLTR